MPDASLKPRARKKQRKDIVRDRLLKRMPKGGVAVEIGVWRGDFSEKILETVQPEKLFLIDPWRSFADHDDAAFSGREAAEKMDQIFADVQERFARETRAGRIEIIREMSVDALDRFADRSISFAYVDGDHSYEGVRADISKLFPKLAFGGVMAFDDYHRRGWWKDGVLQAIHEFVGSQPRSVRMLAVEGAQIAIERIKPQK